MKKYHQSPLLQAPIAYALHKIVCDTSGKPVDYIFEETNTAFEAVTGIPSAVSLGKKVTSVLPGIEKSEEKWIERYGNVALKGGEESFEFYSKPLDKWYKVQAYSPLHGYFVTVFIDITGQKKQYQLLEESFNLIPGLICVTDRNGDFIRVNKEWETILGYMPGELEQKNFLDFVHPEDINITNATMSKLGNSCSALNFVNRIRTFDGSFRYIEWRSTPHHNLIYSSAKDITEQKAALERLQYERDLFTAGPIFTIEWDPSENWPVRNVSDNVHHILGYSAEQMMSPEFRYASLIHPDDIARVSSEVSHNINSMMNTFEQSYRLRCNDGTYRWFYDFTMLVRDSKNALSSILGYMYDQSQQKHIEQSLEAERLRLAGILEGTHVGTWEWNVQTGETVFNERWAEIIGYRLEEISPISIDTWIKYAHPDDLKMSGVQLDMHFRGEIDYYDFESRMLHKNGEWVWVLDRGKVVSWTEDGKPLVMMGTHQDITVRKRAEEELALSEARLRANLENTPNVAVQWYNIDGCVLYWNSASEKLYGWTSEEAIGKTLDQLIYTPEEAEHFLNMLREINTTGKSFGPSEFQFYRRDGSSGWILATTFSFPLEAGRTGFVCMDVDITQSKIAEQELKESEQKQRILLDNIKIQIWYLTDESTYGAVNKAHAEFRGYTIEDLAFRSFFDIFSEHEAVLLQKSNREVFHSGNAVHTEEFAVNAAGEKRLINVIKTPKFRDDGSIEYVVCTAEDITEKQEAEIALQSYSSQLEMKNFQLDMALSEAEAASKSKSEFLANVSHEIRTPMNSILGFSEVMLNTTKDEKQISYLKTILSSGRTLLSLINDILDLSKIEAGKMDLSPDLVNLRRLIDESIQMFMHKAQEKGLMLHAVIDPELPQSVLIDELRLRQILINLIGNAVKFTQKGFVKISISVSEINDSSLTLSVDVEDSGIGIQEKDHALIFESFSQQSGQDSRKYGGTGLGLAITKRLCELMNGTITLKSEPERGTTFTIVFKDIGYENTAVADAANYLWSEEQIEFNGVNIVVADDVRYNRNLIRAFLENFNINIHEAENGQDAVEVVRRIKPDIVFLDLRMPLMDGCHAAEILKNNPETASIPLIALTASTMRNSSESSAESFVGFIRKPVTRATLMGEILKYVPHTVLPGAQIKLHETESESLPSVQMIGGVITEVLRQEFLARFSSRIDKQIDFLIMNELDQLSAEMIGFAAEHSLHDLHDNTTMLQMAVNDFNYDTIQRCLIDIKNLFV